ncbi:MAG TPA: hypothetical protein VFR86_26140 [Burkholderiaceae bacterium]|nr:hypothetical protein [Burkholderiaceae bacterium]
MSNDRDRYDQQYVTTQVADTPPITLDDEVEQFKRLPVDKSDAWEETAFALVAESGDHDVLLWTAGYILKGNGRNVWMDRDAIEHDILFIAVPKANRGRMTDNHFVRAGWHRNERLEPGKLQIERRKDEVVWQFDQQKFIARPPLWQAKGHYAGVDLDLTFKQAGRPLWNWGAFGDVAKAQRAGYDVFARVDGTLATAGRTFEIRDGQGIREHILVGNAIDPIRNLPAPRVMWWLYLMKDGIGINFFRPGIVDIGSVYDGEREIKYSPAAGKGAISYVTTEHWSDPRSGFQLGRRWHLNMTLPECVVDLDISAHGRAYEFWTCDAGVRLYCYLLCVANGFALFRDGRKVEFKEHVMLNSFNRTILVKDERFDGPVY